MIELQRYKENQFIIPSVVDAIYFVDHIVLDVIQLQDDVFKKDQGLIFDGEELVVYKRLKNQPIKTDANIKDRLMIRRVRYYCNKLKTNAGETSARRS